MRRAGFFTIDLFSGAGGMAQGFRSAGFSCVFANDHEAPALATFRRNHPEAATSAESIQNLDAGTIRRQLGLEVGQLDVLLGGPPCQGFSTYGQRDPDDHRNQLYLQFLRFLEEFKPRAFVMENVVGILSIEDGRIIKDIRARVQRIGYGVTVDTLDAVEFGVPQYRKRVFVIGGRDGYLIRMPNPTHRAPQEESDNQLCLWERMDDTLPPVTVRDAISDLPARATIPHETQTATPYEQTTGLTSFQAAMKGDSSQLLHHSAKQMLGIRRLRLALLRPGDYGTRIRARLRTDGLPSSSIEELLSGSEGMRDMEECRREDREKEREIRRILQQGKVDIDEVLARLDAGGFANKYRRLKWDEPSHTLVAHMARDCSDFVHPEIDRFISVREAARLQSFPDTYVFPGSQFQQFRAIGNAVPPLLAHAVAGEIRSFLAQHDAARQGA